MNCSEDYNYIKYTKTKFLALCVLKKSIFFLLFNYKRKYVDL